MGIEAPALRSYFDRLIGFAQQAHWGRGEPSAAAA